MPTLNESIQIEQSSGRLFIKILFGGGIASTPSPIDIDVRECVDGKNFIIRQDNDRFVRRKGFDLIGTVGNAQPIGGFGELIKSDGTASVLVQGGDTVYQWTPPNTFTSVATIPSGVKMRGSRYSSSLIDDQVLITDLNKVMVVKTWDGTTFADFGHDLTGEFMAKYALVDAERAWFFNVKSNSVDTPHVALASARGTTISASDIANLTTTTRPGSGNNAQDPFFLPMPDLRPINSGLAAFGQMVMSTVDGQVWRLTGVDATDFALSGLFRNSGAAGDEAIVYVGNDIIFGRPGRIESLAGVLEFGDVQSDDLSRWVADQVEDVDEWTIHYNPSTNKAYLWPKGGNELWVFNKAIYDPTVRRDVSRGELTVRPPNLSPWGRWTTSQGAGNFQQTAAQLVRRPDDLRDVILFGDADGNIYQLEGDGATDGGNTNISADRLSGQMEAPAGEIFDIKGRIGYKASFSNTVTLNFEMGGVTLFDEAITITIPAVSNNPVFNGSAYFGGDFYFNQTFEGRILRQPFSVPGQPATMQARISVSGANDFEIHDLEIDFERVA